MIDISKKHPWSLNTDSICPSFLDVSAIHRLGNDNYWSIEFHFEFLNYDEDRKVDLISMHPSNLGVFFIKNTIFITLHRNNDGGSIFTKVLISNIQSHHFKISHFPHEKLEIDLNGEIVYTVNLIETPLDYTNHRNFYIGSDTHDNGEDTGLDILRVHELNIVDDTGIISRYTWGDGHIIDDRVKDLTDNDNFLFKVK